MERRINKDRLEYITIHGLEDSFIDKKILYQYRRAVPGRKDIGTADDGYKVFFEETRGSLMRRNYRKSDEITSWNLLISDGKTSRKITLKDLETYNFCLNNGFTVEKLRYFLEHDSKKRSVMGTVENGNQKYVIWVNPEEYELVKKFIKKMRETYGRQK